MSYKINFSSNKKTAFLEDYKFIASSTIQNKIKELKNNKDELKFILKLDHLYTIQLDEIELIKEFKEVRIKKDKLIIPYWIQFNYYFSKNELDYIFSILWIKKKNDIINNIIYELKQYIEEPFIYKVIDIVEKNLKDTLTENNIISFLRQIKLYNIKNLSFENALFTISEANKDCPEFLYPEEQNNPNDYDIYYNNTYLQKIISKSANNSSEYHLFFQNGGINTDVFEDKDHEYQCHCIKVKSKEEIDKYLSYLYSNSKIRNAIRNIVIYKYKDNNGNIIKDYDDYGEIYSGTKLLEIIEEYQICNILMLVTRFNGDFPLKLHSPAYFTITEILIKDNQNYFDY